MDDNRVVMAVDVGVNAVEALEDLTDSLTEVLGKRVACTVMSACIVWK